MIEEEIKDIIKAVICAAHIQFTVRDTGRSIFFFCRYKQIHFNVHIGPNGIVRIWQTIVMDLCSEIWPEILKIIKSIISEYPVIFKITEDVDLQWISEEEILGPNPRALFTKQLVSFLRMAGTYGPVFRHLDAGMFLP